MKQLKFMLAAATAISLATAAQAARFSGSTDFEGNFDLATGFTFNGTSGDNESAIVPGVPSNTVGGVLTELAEANRPANHGFTATRANILQVNTGTEPIVRSVDGTTDGVSLAGGDVYVDTLVQFTVTPDGDTVTPGDSDKLMVYLKETKNGDTATTNLIVHAGILNRTVPEATPFTVSNVEVESGKWYRLTVRAISNLTTEEGMSFPAFVVSINGTVCQFDASCVANDPDSESDGYEGNGLIYPFGELDYNSEAYRLISANKVVLSLVQEATLKAVGFAGEGKVDDLVISTFDPTKTVVDFTLTLAGDVADGLSSDATYTSSAAGTVTLNSGENACVRYSDENVTISYSPAEGYKAEWSEGGSASFAPTAGTTYTLTVSQVAQSTVDFTLTLAEGVSSVKFTIGDTEYTATKAESPKTFDDLPYAALVFGKIEYAAWYVAGNVKEGVSITLSADKKAETVDAKNVKTSEGGTASFVETATTATAAATALGVNNEVFTTGKTDADAKAVLKKGLDWATKIGAAPSALNDVQFETNGDPKKGTAAEAYLLNCAQDDVATEIAKFTVKSITFDEFNNPVFEVGNKELNDSKVADGGEYCNGHVEVRGATALDADDAFKAAKKEGDKFFKAFLVK